MALPPVNPYEITGTSVYDPLLDPVKKAFKAVNPLSELSAWTQDNPLFDLIAKFENKPLWLGLKNPSDPNAITSHKANIPVKGDDPTSGFGFKYKQDGTPYQAGEEVTAEEAEARLRTEGVGDALDKISRYVDPEVWGRMSDSQKRSVISLFHNVNEGSLAESDALRSLNEGNFQLFSQQAYGPNGFNKAFGQVHSGLQARRAEEGALFDSEEAMPVSPVSVGYDESDPYRGIAPVYFGKHVTPSENNIIDKIISLPRGFGKSFARMIAAEIPEGLWALADLTTNLAGFEDVLNEKESAFLDRLQEIRDMIGYEEAVPGRLGEALGSMAAFVAGGWATGGLKALTALPKLLKGGNYGKALLNTWYGTLPGQTFAVSEQNLRMKAARESGIDYDEGQRNSALSLAVPVGMLEYAAWFPLMRGLSRKVVSPDRIQRIIGMTSEAMLTGGVEGGQEVIASILQDTIEKNIYNPDIAIGESWADEFGYGAGAGAIFDIVLNIANRKGRKFDRSGDPDDLIKPVPEEELAEVEEEVLGTGPVSGVRTVLEGEEEIDLDPLGPSPAPVDVGTTQEDIDLVAQGQVEAEAARQRGEVVDAAPDIVVEEEIGVVKEPAVVEEEAIKEEVIEEAPPVEAEPEKKKYINYKEQLKDHPFLDLMEMQQEVKVLPLIEEGFAGRSKVASLAAGYSADLVRTDLDSTNPITPLEARKILQYQYHDLENKTLAQLQRDKDIHLGGEEGWIDRIFESELIEVALGKKSKPLNSFWVGISTSYDPQIERLSPLPTKLEAAKSGGFRINKASQDVVDRILAKNPKPMSLKEVREIKKLIESLNQQGAVFHVEEDGTLASIKDKSKFLIDEETALSIYPQESKEVEEGVWRGWKEVEERDEKKSCIFYRKGFCR